MKLTVERIAKVPIAGFTMINPNIRSFFTRVVNYSHSLVAIRAPLDAICLHFGGVRKRGDSSRHLDAVINPKNNGFEPAYFNFRNIGVIHE